MNTLNSFILHNNITTTGTSEPVVINLKAEQIILEVKASSTITLKILGQAQTDEWHEFAIINAKTMEVQENITGAGIYYVVAAGLTKLKTQITNISGSATVVALVQG